MSNSNNDNIERTTIPCETTSFVSQQPTPVTHELSNTTIIEATCCLDIVMRSIQTDLEHVEDHLERRNTFGQFIGGAGNSIRESIQTALGAIRTRLSMVEAENENGTVAPSANNENNNNAVPPLHRDLGFSFARIQYLSQRIETAELSNTANVPLALMRSNAVRSATTASGDGNTSLETTVVIAEQPNSSPSTLQSPALSSFRRSSITLIDGVPTPTNTRRASILVVSRRSSTEIEGLSSDMDLHSVASSVALFRASDEPYSSGIEVQLQLPRQGDETESDPMDLSDDDTNNNIDAKLQIASTPTPDDHTNLEDTKKVTPILLTQKSMENLRTLSQTVLFPLDEDATSIASTQPTRSEVAVYSWGSGLTSLHETIDDVTIDCAQILATSRVGRSEIVSCSIGPYHSACCDSAGRVLCKGRNKSGAVDPDRKDDEAIIHRPMILESLGHARIVQVSCGADHTAALRSNGVVLTWGSNEYGQLGHRCALNQSTPNTFCHPAVMAIGFGQRVTAVACGDGFTLCLNSRMTLLACGDELMAGYRKNEDVLPASIPAVMDLPVVSIAAGRRHAAIVTVHGTVFAWGENPQGCCGKEYPKVSSVPVPLKVPASKNKPIGRSLPEPLSNWAYWNGEESTNNYASVADDVAVIHAALGSDHTVLVTKSGRLFVCGSNKNCQLGLSPHNSYDTVFNLEPVYHPKAGEGFHFVMAAAGDAHTLVLDNAGKVWQFGKFGSSDGTSIQALPMAQIKWVAAGGTHSVAVASRQSDDTMEVEPSQGDSVEALLAELVEKTQMDDQQPCAAIIDDLADRTHELLRTPAVLNGLFLDPTELDDLFKKLLSVTTPTFRKKIVASIESGILSGLNALATDGSRLIFTEQIRCLLLYVQCPLFVDWKMDDIFFDRRGDLILKLCEIILELPYEGYRALMGWASSVYTKDNFVKLLLKPLLTQLGKGLSKSAGAEARPVPSIAAILKWLHAASERVGNLATAENFYCEAINTLSAERMLEDLMNYHKATKEQRSGMFFLFNYPFLIAPNAKRILLQMENEMNMLKTAATGLTYNPASQAYEFNPFYTVDVDREYLLTQTLDKISKAEPKDLRRKLRVVFKGEDGVDAGGVTREFFQLLSAQLFDISTGMWSSRYQDGQVTWFNADCSWNDEGFFLSGVLVGLAVYNSVLLDVHFPTAVYRKLLGLPLGMEDIVDEEVKAGLYTLLKYEGDDVEDVFCLAFDVPYMDLGVEKRRELKPNGSNISVTKENKEEYVLLYTKWMLQDSIYPQYEAFEEGFLRVMENSSFHILSPEELELLSVGTPDLDFKALRKNATYEGYNEDSEVVVNCWKFIENATRDVQLQFLKFTTGSSRAPIGGLGALPFKIQRAGPDSDHLPTAHTCFNTLLLPDYGPNIEKLKNRLGRAILECEGFGLQ